ncbi:hypothetical protein LZP73_05645 [Shewanella sp. AS16]|uniref:hypothetical protein n=1 Tax=Shewanella sp. AS16 TaxID=2907625 RepID=UPI001F400FF4|nr:hypothetical protein [Shewanella sp. AS16]MCE9685699.1 hypothetical protein [Shewanella sp. AS16]
MWDISKLKTHLDSLDEPSDLHSDYLWSISRTITIYEYHKSEAYSALMDIEPKDHEDAINFVLSNSDENNDFEYKVIIIQAHMQASLYSARAMFDIFAQLINLLLLSGKRPVHHCYVHDVCDLLIDSPVKTALRDILNSHEYKYVSAFINVIKHRNLLQFTRTLDFTELKSGVRVKNFKFKDQSFGQKWAIDALESSLIIKNKLVDLGELLNQVCGVKDA